jgi:hypothetical protein
MRASTLIGALLLAPAALAGQTGSIAYTQTIQLEFDIPDEVRARFGRGPGGGDMLPTERTNEVLLIFNGTASLMKQIPPERPRPGAEGAQVDRHRAEMTAFFQRSSARRADRETLVEAYTRYDEGTIVEAREFLGRTFLIEEQRPSYEWRLSNEQAEFLGYMVQKAVAVQDSSTIEAWFTPQIPVMGGPGPYGGLPGMILVLSVDGGKTQYSATGVSLTAVADDVIVKPDEGDTVSRDEYEQIVAEKLEELRATRRRIR